MYGMENSKDPLECFGRSGQIEHYFIQWKIDYKFLNVYLYQVVCILSQI